tara:strand:+ start:2177 stop:2428 length:252 start_codon:yes stop_codon:yes gene_type:complete
MPSKNPTIKKGYKDGLISKGQYDKLPDALLLGIIKKKSGTKKGEVKPKKSPPKKGVKENRHKIGEEKHKRGRPKGGSKVEVSS